jgi:hypothetical protein
MDNDGLDELAMHLAASDNLEDGLAAGFASIQKDRQPRSPWPLVAALIGMLGFIAYWLFGR